MTLAISPATASLTLATLRPGDEVEIIAPASRSTDQQLQALHDLLTSWQLKCIIDDNIFGEDILCANDDAQRFQSLATALHRPRTKAIICARGGYGSMRLIPALARLSPPATSKLFLGMSDITALHLFLQQTWHWPTLHASLSPDKFSPESIAATKALLFGETTRVTFTGSALNAAAKKSTTIESIITGGNLCLLQHSIGTSWQIEAKNKILFLEEVGERGYRVDRMLEHLKQAGRLNQVKAIIFGDFIEGKESDGSSLIEPVLARFANEMIIPVIKIAGIGHGYQNFPLPLGTKAQLTLGREIKLVCER